MAIIQNNELNYELIKKINLCGPSYEAKSFLSTYFFEIKATSERRFSMLHAAKIVLSELAKKSPILKNWAESSRNTSTIQQAVDPIDDLWQSLQIAMRLPNYPADAQVLTESPGIYSITIKTACPYNDFVSLAFSLIQTLLNFGNVVLNSNSVNLNISAENWENAYKKLSTLLPPQEVQHLHHDLWRQGIAWQWLGGNKTRVGCGHKQRVVVGAPADLDLSDPHAWRIPIYTVTGSVGKTTTARLLFQLLEQSVANLALAASDGAWLGQQQLSKGDCIGGRSAQALLRMPAVMAAVLEQGRGGIVKQGVPYAQSDVGILLNVQAVHLGVDGIQTLEQMANTKVVGLHPARIWVLNHDDEQCRRLGGQHTACHLVWFSLTADAESLCDLSRNHKGAIGVLRNMTKTEQEEASALQIYESGQEIQRLPLNGVAPYHGMMGEKTLEELLAAVAAAWFGPLPVKDWAARLSALRLDSNNHAFRSSVHHQNRVIFVLDKAAETASLKELKNVVNELAKRENCEHRIVVLTRSAGEPPERHLESAEVLFSFMDEVVYFDRQDTYTTAHALPIYTPGSIPELMHQAFEQQNQFNGTQKSISLLNEWVQVEHFLRKRLPTLKGKTLVLINQPGTGLTELNQKILDFVNEKLSQNL